MKKEKKNFKLGKWKFPPGLLVVGSPMTADPRFWHRWGPFSPLSVSPWLSWRGRRGGIVCVSECVCVEEGKLSYPFPLWIGQPGVWLSPRGLFSLSLFLLSKLLGIPSTGNDRGKVESLKVWFQMKGRVRILSRNSILLQPSGSSPSHRFSSTSWSKRGKECVFQNNYPLASRVFFCKVGKNYLIAEI